MPARQGISSGVSVGSNAGYIIFDEPSTAEQEDSNVTLYYYGFVSHDGGWYYQRRDTSTGLNYFAVGDYDVVTAMNNKASLTYDRWDITMRS